MCDVEVGPGPHCQERCKDIELNHNKTYPRLPGVTGGHIFSPSSFLQIKSGHKHREPRPLSLTMVSSATWRGYLGYYGQWRYGVWGWMGLTDVWPGCPWQAGPRIRTLSMWPWGGYVMLCHTASHCTALVLCWLSDCLFFLLLLLFPGPRSGPSVTSSPLSPLTRPSRHWLRDPAQPLWPHRTGSYTVTVTRQEGEGGGRGACWFHSGGAELGVLAECVIVSYDVMTSPLI